MCNLSSVYLQASCPKPVTACEGTLLVLMSKISCFLDVTPYTLVHMYRRFGGTYCLHVRSSIPKTQPAYSSKYLYVYTRLYAVTSQKTLRLRSHRDHLRFFLNYSTTMFQLQSLCIGAEWDGKKMRLVVVDFALVFARFFRCHVCPSVSELYSIYARTDIFFQTNSVPGVSEQTFFQVTPQLYSPGWLDPVPDPLLLTKSGRAWNRTQTSGSVARNWPQRLLRPPWCLCVCDPPPPAINFWIPEGIFIILDISWHLSPSQRRLQKIFSIALCYRLCVPRTIPSQSSVDV
jgi:hypothetical protein